MRKSFFALPALLALAGCGSITAGSDRMVEVRTEPSVPAACLLESGHGRSVVARTPGAARVPGSRRDLRVECSAPGGWHGHAVVESGSTLAAAVGNTLVGGTLGTLTDVATGAAFAYGPSVTVRMSRDARPPNR